MKSLILVKILILITTTSYAKPLVFDINEANNIKPKIHENAIHAISFTHQTSNANHSHWLDNHLYQTAHQYGINPLLIKAIIKVESGYQIDARSPKGALGLMQVLPTTAVQYGKYNLLNPKDNITVGTQHFAYLMKRYRHQIPIALAAYNAGEGNVNKYQGIPPFAETQQYVLKVLRHYKALQSQNEAKIIMHQDQDQHQSSAGQELLHKSNLNNTKSQTPKSSRPIIIELN